MEIGNVVFKDLPKIKKIEEETFLEAYPKDLFIMVLEMCKETFLIAREDDKVLGYIIGYVRDNDEGHIMSIAVDPSYRSQGIGEKLLKEDMKRLMERGANRIGLEVRTSNKGAIRFYENLNFEKTRRVKDYYQNGEDAWYMIFNNL